MIIEKMRLSNLQCIIIEGFILKWTPTRRGKHIMWRIFYSSPLSFMQQFYSKPKHYWKYIFTGEAS